METLLTGNLLELALFARRTRTSLIPASLQNYSDRTCMVTVILQQGQPRKKRNWICPSFRTTPVRHHTQQPFSEDTIGFAKNIDTKEFCTKIES